MIGHAKTGFSPTKPERGRALGKRANGQRRPEQKMGSIVMFDLTQKFPGPVKRRRNRHGDF